MINRGRASMAWLSVRAESQKDRGAGQGEVRTPFREKPTENRAGLCAEDHTLTHHVQRLEIPEESARRPEWETHGKRGSAN
jgi:hypothetical protein